MQAGKIALCVCPISPLRASAGDTSEIVSQVLFGEIVSVQEVSPNWIKIETWLDGYQGFCDPKQYIVISEKEARKWLVDDYTFLESRESHIDSNFGALLVPQGAVFSGEFNEKIEISNCWFQRKTKNTEKFITPFQTAESYLNSPYLWGGKTPFGIDCSGLTQQVFRFHGYKLPRDASQQVTEGVSIDFEERLQNDLAFFSNKDGKIIHVGILGEGNQIIHASGRVRIDELKPQGIWNSENETFTHTLAAIKRIL
jgi:gamma-D-glutamyl-L-lysine dipeptidyl-peptidase